MSVPVTILPAPTAANARSIHRRGRLTSGAEGAVSVILSMARRRLSNPFLLIESTQIIGADSRKVPIVRSSTSIFAISIVSSSTKPVCVRTTIPCVMPKSSRIRKCSSDCGFQPSGAATTNMHASTDPTPASMFFKNLMCPGTSINEICLPEGNSVNAKPRSMVRPRSFSSLKRSGSVPVNARTKVDLP